MSCLLLHLEGPLQAWGSSSRFTIRATENLPTKSGVIGLLAAAEGRAREDDITDLVKLRFGTRIEAPGTVLRDFQTETDWRTGKSKALTQRYYLQDAKFLAVVEGETSMLESLQQALRRPAFPLFLGRRACAPSRPIAGDIVEGNLVDALETTSWNASKHDRRRQESKVILPYSRDVLDDESAEEMIRDEPVSFSQSDRRYNLRGVIHGFVEITNKSATTPRSSVHDPMAALGGA
ncbi:type I-E CRISPR-associated protein Cas5/CasD [Corynebacterium breve]|uniref:Type I-E CRISPR-associated protein Cas5/CasD n=1 Tax=Corynebacterium breve TaxID=3049799 RepID=A0ABY8VFH2_9CORY|nr:type I-E CRISPR-associated protein Cas5/CasD [Corynebacterium breve]WIM67716.1 type I-E CRISPR-associated protein Cas5/CasD [Corynebacterium breve]